MNRKIIASATAENKGDIYKTELESDSFNLIADEPLDLGGKDIGPSPGALICMSLASCKAITLRMYAQRKDWQVSSIRVSVQLVKGSETESGNNTFYCEIALDGNLSNEERKRMLDIAKACPISKLIQKPSDVISSLV